MQIEARRGDIFYINNDRHQVGREMKKDRPAIIVSNDANNRNSDTVTVVFLTTSPKKELPTHVTIRSASKVSEALCEQPTAVDIQRLQSYCGRCTDKEMQEIDIALEIALGIHMTREQQEKLDMLLESCEGGYCIEVDAEATDNDKELAQAIVKAETERDVFKQLYEGLMERLVTGGRRE